MALSIVFCRWISFQAKAIAEPFAFEEYRKKRIQDKIEEERANRVKLKVRRNMTFLNCYFVGNKIVCGANEMQWTSTLYKEQACENWAIYLKLLSFRPQKLPKVNRSLAEKLIDEKKDTEKQTAKVSLP